MKKAVLIALTIIVLTFLSCQNKNIATLKVSNPDNKAVAFSGFYSSSLLDSSRINGITPATYKIDVNPEDDYIRAGFTKTTVTDGSSKLRVELIYLNKTKDVKTATVPLLGWAVVSCDIP